MPARWQRRRWGQGGGGDKANQQPLAGRESRGELPTAALTCGRTSSAFLPPMVTCRTSGYCVDEWLPQMMAPSTASSVAPALMASSERARLWSRRVRAVTFFAGTSGAAFFRIAAFVLAGLPTTRHLTVFLAFALSAPPCGQCGECGR